MPAAESGKPTLRSTLTPQIALVLGEHVASDDELHITYSALQTGWQHGPERAGWLGRRPHTQLFLEYTALLALRASGWSEEDQRSTARPPKSWRVAIGRRAQPYHAIRSRSPSS